MEVSKPEVNTIGRLTETNWRGPDGFLHRKNGPAYESYLGEIRHRKSWFVDGLQHRLGKPADISYSVSGNNIIEEKYYLFGNQHRVNGPALIQYYNTGEVIYEEWFYKDEVHRTDGPAMISYDRNGNITEREWVLHNKLLQKKDFTLKMIEEMDAFSLFNGVEIARLKLNGKI